MLIKFLVCLVKDLFQFGMLSSQRHHSFHPIVDLPSYIIVYVLVIFVEGPQRVEYLRLETQGDSPRTISHPQQGITEHLRILISEFFLVSCMRGELPDERTSSLMVLARVASLVACLLKMR